MRSSDPGLRPVAVTRWAARRLGAMMFIDAHAHLDRYGEMLGSALEEIEQRSIFTISNSMDLDSYRAEFGDRQRVPVGAADFRGPSEECAQRCF